MLEQITILFCLNGDAFEELDTLIFVILIFEKRERDFSTVVGIERFL